VLDAWVAQTSSFDVYGARLRHICGLNYLHYLTSGAYRRARLFDRRLARD